MGRSIQYGGVLAATVLLSLGCDGRFGSSSNAAVPTTVSTAAPPRTREVTVGRFQLLQAAHPDAKTPFTLRMDTVTGETWRLQLLPEPRWFPISDNLTRVGTYNPKTQQIEWHTRTLDGRDLSALSKEELLRMLEAGVPPSASTNSKDPLGLFEVQGGASR